MKAACSQVPHVGLTLAMYGRATLPPSLFSLTSEYEYCRIDGNTPHDTRQDLIEEYNAPVCSCSLHFNWVPPW